MLVNAFQQLSKPIHVFVFYPRRCTCLSALGVLASCWIPQHCSLGSESYHQAMQLLARKSNQWAVHWLQCVDVSLAATALATHPLPSQRALAPPPLTCEQLRESLMATTLAVKFAAFRCLDNLKLRSDTDWKIQTIIGSTVALSVGIDNFDDQETSFVLIRTPQMRQLRR